VKKPPASPLAKHLPSKLLSLSLSLSNHIILLHMNEYHIYLVPGCQPLPCGPNRTGPGVSVGLIWHVYATLERTDLAPHPHALSSRANHASVRSQYHIYVFYIHTCSSICMVSGAFGATAGAQAIGNSRPKETMQTRIGLELPPSFQIWTRIGLGRCGYGPSMKKKSSPTYLPRVTYSPHHRFVGE
jgi:hypothetical protein